MAHAERFCSTRWSMTGKVSMDDYDSVLFLGSDLQAELDGFGQDMALQPANQHTEEGYTASRHQAFPQGQQRESLSQLLHKVGLPRDTPSVSRTRPSGQVPQMRNDAAISQAPYREQPSFPEKPFEHFPSFSSDADYSSLSKEQRHAMQLCAPCSYFAFKEDGCRNGDNCTHCHICTKEDAISRRRLRKIDAKIAKRTNRAGPSNRHM
eukprot:TRINITY_DN35898_c0_g1_i2.p1 TRINITY_DN35898_c0_g1~~TRINITY_DN35898_c0_g1_i2.p1  ORF type:complete len:217 (+),score=29.84 TRINITY_DN35898_c0_g1_i2:28-651(+)